MDEIDTSVRIGRQRIDRNASGQFEGGVVHGMSRTPEYTAWKNMIQRCCNPKATGFSEYGGRGISVCDRWKRSFEDFLEDVGPRPGKGYSIDRQRVNGNYEPGNCFWKTQREQNRNQRKNIMVSIGGETLTLVDAVERLGLKYNTILYRIRRGKTPEQALNLNDSSA